LAGEDVEVVDDRGPAQVEQVLAAWTTRATTSVTTPPIRCAGPSAMSAGQFGQL